MKLYATIKNERGGKKSTGDDTRVLVELTYKNKVVGEVGLYSVFNENEDLGYRVVFQDTKGRDEVIKEEVKGTSKKGKNIHAPSRQDWIDDGKDDTY